MWQVSVIESKEKTKEEKRENLQTFRQAALF